MGSWLDGRDLNCPKKKSVKSAQHKIPSQKSKCINIVIIINNNIVVSSGSSSCCCSITNSGGVGNSGGNSRMSFNNFYQLKDFILEKLLPKNEH